MCLVIPIDAEPMTAETDITVYKILRADGGSFVSPYMGTHYHIGDTYRTEMGEDDILAFDSRNSDYLSRTIGHDWWDRSDILKAIGKGIHSVSDPSRLCGDVYIGLGQEKAALVQCTIPVGANYYDDGDLCMVSDTLRVDREIAREDWPDGFNRHFVVVKAD